VFYQQLIESPTPWDWLNLKPTTSPPKKKTHTSQRMLIMEEGYEEMEVDIITP
jgi:hypothetical protein